MKLFLPILDNGQGDVKADFLDCFIRAFSGANVHTARLGDSDPRRCRNRVAAAFLRTDCTHLLFIDGDIKFTASHITMLAESDAPILGGIYCLKTTEAAKPCLQTLPGYSPTETGGYLPVARTGTGFLRIAREVFEAMKTEANRYTNHGLEEWDFFPSGVVNGEYLSEDWGFCDRARELGFEVLIDTRIQLLHRGELDFPLQREPERLQYCSEEMKPHIERIWKGEYAIPLEPEPKTVLDIGANIGGFTEWACEQWPGARIEAFEPHPENAVLFGLNTKPREHRVNFARYGVRGEEGHCHLVEGGNAGEHSFLFDGEGVFVPCVAAGSLDSAEFVKIDTEGCELEILRGLDLSKTRAIALEYHSASDRAEIPALLDSRGFNEIAHEPLTVDRGILKFTRK